MKNWWACLLCVQQVCTYGNCEGCTTKGGFGGFGGMQWSLMQVCKNNGVKMYHCLTGGALMANSIHRRGKRGLIGRRKGETGEMWEETGTFYRLVEVERRERQRDRERDTIERERERGKQMWAEERGAGCSRGDIIPAICWFLIQRFFAGCLLWA